MPIERASWLASWRAPFLRASSALDWFCTASPVSPWPIAPSALPIASPARPNCSWPLCPDSCIRRIMSASCSRSSRWARRRPSNSASAPSRRPGWRCEPWPWPGPGLLVAVAGLSALLVLAHRSLLAEPEGLVHQFLLAPDDVGEFFQRLRHALLLGVLLHLARTQAFEHVAQFAEKLLRLVAGPGPGHVLDGVEHLVEVLRGDRLEVLHVRQFGDVAGVLHPPGHFLHELVQRLAQFLHQAGNLLIGRVALERLLQGFLGCAQVPRDVRQVAILDEKRHLPEHVHDRTQRVVVTGQPQPVGGRAQPQVNRRRHIEHIRRQRQQFQRPPDRALAGAGRARACGAAPPARAPAARGIPVAAA